MWYAPLGNLAVACSCPIRSSSTAAGTRPGVCFFDDINAPYEGKPSFAGHAKFVRSSNMTFEALHVTRRAMLLRSIDLSQVVATAPSITLRDKSSLDKRPLNPQDRSATVPARQIRIDALATPVSNQES